MTFKNNGCRMTAVGRDHVLCAPDLVVTGQADKPSVFAKLYNSVCNTIKTPGVAERGTNL
jgi:hypothetical protein